MPSVLQFPSEIYRKVIQINFNIHKSEGIKMENITLEKKGAVAVVTISRPEKLNALNNATLVELKDVFQSLTRDDSVTAIVLTGAGEKAFVAGADIKELSESNLHTGGEFAKFGQEIFNLIEQSAKPVIAAVNGFALGGGCELALSCHVRLASKNAKFGQPEVNLGIIPGYGGTQRLTRLVGKGTAMELILTGDLISADEAYRIGLVNKVYDQSELLDKAIELAEKISSKGQVAVKNAIRAINAAGETPLQEGLKIETDSFSICCGSNDFKEGTSAFLEKRKPEFKNT